MDGLDYLNPELTFDLMIGGLVLPHVIALVNQCKWSPKLKGLVALLVCFLTAAVLAAWRGDLDWHDWRNAAVVLTASALGMYRLLWRPSDIAPAIERATSATPSCPPEPRRT